MELWERPSLAATSDMIEQQVHAAVMCPLKVGPNIQVTYDHSHCSFSSVNFKIVSGHANTMRSAKRLTNAVSASVVK